MESGQDGTTAKVLGVGVTVPQKEEGESPGAIQERYATDGQILLRSTPPWDIQADSSPIGPRPGRQVGSKGC